MRSTIRIPPTVIAFIYQVGAVLHLYLPCLFIGFPGQLIQLILLIGWVLQAFTNCNKKMLFQSFDSSWIGSSNKMPGELACTAVVKATSMQICPGKIRAAPMLL